LDVNNIVRSFKPELGNRKEERDLPAFGGARGDQGLGKPQINTNILKNKKVRR